MMKLKVIICGMIATFMLKQSFYIAPTVTQKNIWIIIGCVVLVFLAIENYYIKSKTTKLAMPIKQPLKQMVGVDLQLEMELKNIVKRDGKIEAIKHLREESGMGLREAKEFVDDLV